MKLTLPPNDWDESLKSYGFTQQMQGAETRMIMPGSFISGSIHETQLRSGLQISTEAYTPHEDLVLEEYLAQTGALRFCFYLSGYSRVQCEHDGSPFLTLERVPGQNYLAFGGANTQLTWEFAPHHPFKIVNVWLEAWLLQALSEQWQLALPTPLQQIAQGNRQQPYLHLGYMTPALKIVVYQLLNCNYQGITRYLYLEGKALELIALKLEQMANQPDINKRYRPLKPRERIYQAREILLCNLEHFTVSPGQPGRIKRSQCRLWQEVWLQSQRPQTPARLKNFA